MTLTRGNVVRSVAGHDKGDLFLILREEGDFVWLADGKRRKFETPKKKRRKHVVSAGVWTHPVIGRLTDGLEKMEGVVIHGPEGDLAAPHIVNASFTGIGAEVLLHSLEDRGIFISAGSACSTHKRAGSPTLTAIAIPKEEASSAVRFSFCDENTEEEVDIVLEALTELLPLLRRYRRK